MAESYVDEIAADQHLQVHHVLYYVLKWLFWKVFDVADLKESDFVRLKATNAEGSLIYVSCHKSHFDYLYDRIFVFHQSYGDTAHGCGQEFVILAHRARVT